MGKKKAKSKRKGSSNPSGEKIFSNFLKRFIDFMSARLNSEAGRVNIAGELITLVAIFLLAFKDIAATVYSVILLLVNFILTLFDKAPIDYDGSSDMYATIISLGILFIESIICIVVVRWFVKFKATHSDNND